MHIAGDDNCWAYLLSRWVTRSEGPVCTHASVGYTDVLFDGRDRLPTKEVVRGVQAAAAEGGPTRDTQWGWLLGIPKGCTGWGTMATA